MTMMSILTQPPLPSLSIHIFITFHLLLLPSLSHYTLIILILCSSRGEMHLLVGDEKGRLRVLVQDSDYLRERLQSKLIEIGIL
jgi:hypothetical protein